MARLRLFTSFFSLLILVSIYPSAHADDSAAPYIYYYDNISNTLVVERADGSDSRFIALGVMYPESTVISDLDWSPSGRWLAWTSSTYNHESGVGGYSAWITRSDGTDRVTLLDNLYHILALKWSPTGDLIYVNYFTSDLTIKFIIIDPNTNAIVAQTDYQYGYTGMWLEGIPTGWLPDGSGIYFHIYFENLSSLLGELSITNQTSNRVFEPSQSNPGRILNLTRGRLLSYETFYDETPQTSVVMRDLGTEKSVLIASPSALLDPYHQGFEVYWNPTMTHALILEWTCDEQTEYCRYPNPATTHLYLLDWAAATLQLLGTRMQVSGYEREYGRLSAGPRASDFWSPDGRFSLIVDEGKHLAIVDATTGELFPSINLPSVIGWYWTAPSDALIFYSYFGQQLYRYDLKTRSLTPLAVSFSPYSWFSLSPDGRFVAMIDGYNTPDMFDLKTRSKRRWPHHSLGSSAGPIQNYVWHPDSHWFMTGEQSTFSSGGPGPSAVTLFNTAATIRRELSVCSYLGGCAGFVPDRVLPYLGEGSPTSVIPQPQYALPHTNQVVAVAWSPDGTKIATYSLKSSDTIDGKITLWDVSGTPQRLIAYDSNLAYARFASLIWSPNGRSIILNNGDVEETWDMQSGTRIAVRSLKYWRPTNYVTRVILSPDRRYTLYARDDARDITIINNDTGETVTTLASEQTRAILWSNDSQTLFVVKGYGSVMVWHNHQWQVINGEYGDMSVAVDAIHKFIFSASFFDRISVWHAQTGQQLPDINGYARNIALSPDGTRLAAAGTSLVTIWDTADFERIGE